MGAGEWPLLRMAALLGTALPAQQVLLPPLPGTFRAASLVCAATRASQLLRPLQSGPGLGTGGGSGDAWLEPSAALACQGPMGCAADPVLRVQLGSYVCVGTPPKPWHSLWVALRAEPCPGTAEILEPSVAGISAQPPPRFQAFGVKVPWAVSGEQRPPSSCFTPCPHVDAVPAGHIPQDPGFPSCYHGHLHHDSGQDLSLPYGELMAGLGGG